MDYIIFIYNVLLIVLFAMNITCFIIFYVRAHKMSYLWVAAMFLLFIAENLILYMADFLESFAAFYNMHTLSEPLLKTLISIGVYLCYLFVGASFFQSKPEKVDWIVYLVYVASLVLVPLLPTMRFTYWLYFTLSQIMFAYIGLRCLAAQKKMPAQTPEQQTCKKQLQYFLWIALALNALIVLEDIVVIFFFDNLSPQALRITQRNLSEDVQSIFFGIAGMCYFFKYFFVPVAPLLEQENLVHYEQATAVLREKKTAQLCKTFSLTSREREVLTLLLSGKTNVEISSELFISTGTVKNHIHNIYQKTGAAGRGQIIRMVESVLLEEV